MSEFLGCAMGCCWCESDLRESDPHPPSPLPPARPPAVCRRTLPVSWLFLLLTGYQRSVFSSESREASSMCVRPSSSEPSMRDASKLISRHASGLFSMRWRNCAWPDLQRGVSDRRTVSVRSS